MEAQTEVLNPALVPGPHVLVPELLAPAGGRAQFLAALGAGADAVFLGLKDFNARGRAENFSADDLRECLPLARAFGMKVLVTVNVLVKDTELSSVTRLLATLEDLGVDAIIVQDLAVAKIARESFPGLRLHASTQLAVHNAAGVLEAARAGFRRVVLARELTALELRNIRARFPREQVELEAFCHGSLCYSYSGLCFFSGAQDARSGNRGECAYTCRQPYKILNEPGHGFLFSMKDLDTHEHLEMFLRAGVDTLKIEGRKKDAQFVASVVRVYRRKLDEILGRPTLRESAPASARAASDEEMKALLEDLSLSFQRKPTSFFLRGRYAENVIDLANPTHVGVRVGEVLRVDGDRLTVRTEVPLEKYDGLRVSSRSSVYHARPQHGERVDSDVSLMQKTYENEICQFSLREMFLRGAPRQVAPAGAEVELTWQGGDSGGERSPSIPSKPRPGDLVTKVRSSDLRRRTEAIAQVPEGERVRPLSFVDVRVSARREPRAQPTVRIEVRVARQDAVILAREIFVPEAHAKGNATLRADCEALFSLFGDASVQAGSLDLALEDETWFVPRSLLKGLKRDIARELPKALDEFRGRRLERALSALPAPRRERARTLSRAERRFAVKSDSIETLETALAFARGTDGFTLSELVFEPKKSRLSDDAFRSPLALAEKLRSLETSSVRVRLALPTVIRAWDEPLLSRWVKACAEAGIAAFEVGNLGAFALLDDWMAKSGEGNAGRPKELDLSTDFTLYALNSVATRALVDRRPLAVRKVTLSIEDDRTDLASHLDRWPRDANTGAELDGDAGVRPQAILYKDTPLFIAEACSLTALHGGCPTAQVCGYRTLEIENPAGERFFVAHENCKSIVYGAQAFSLTHQQDFFLSHGVRDFRLDFLTRAYTREQLEACLRAAHLGVALPETHSANFARSLL